MKLLGKNSIASFLKVFSDFLLGLFILLFIGALIFLVVRFSHPEYTIYDWPIDLDPEISSSSIHPISPGKEAIEITSRDTEITFHTKQDWRIVSYMISGIIVISIWIFRLLWLLRLILISLVNKNPFIRENGLRFREIAILVMIFPFLKAFKHLLTSLYLRANFRFEAHISNPLTTFVNHFDLIFILVGLMLLLLAEIFRIGTEYKTDSSMII